MGLDDATAEDFDLRLRLLGRSSHIWLVRGEFDWDSQTQAHDAWQVSAERTALSADGCMSLQSGNITFPLMEDLQLTGGALVAPARTLADPGLRVMLKADNGKLHFSPQRAEMLMRIADELSGKRAAAAARPAWLDACDCDGPLLVLRRSELASPVPTWAPMHAVLVGSQLFFLATTAEGMLELQFQHSVRSTARVSPLAPGFSGGASHALAVHKPGVALAAVMEDPDAVVLRARDANDRERWRRALRAARSSTMVRGEDEVLAAVDPSDWLRGQLDITRGVGLEDVAGGARAPRQRRKKAKQKGMLLGVTMGVASISLYGPAKVLGAPDVKRAIALSGAPGAANDQFEADLELEVPEVRYFLMSAIGAAVDIHVDPLAGTKIRVLADALAVRSELMRLVGCDDKYLASTHPPDLLNKRIEQLTAPAEVRSLAAVRSDNFKRDEYRWEDADLWEDALDLTLKLAPVPMPGQAPLPPPPEEPRANMDVDVVLGTFMLRVDPVSGAATLLLLEALGEAAKASKVDARAPPPLSPRASVDPVPAQAAALRARDQPAAGEMFSASQSIAMRRTTTPLQKAPELVLPGDQGVEAQPSLRSFDVSSPSLSPRAGTLSPRPSLVRDIGVLESMVAETVGPVAEEAVRAGGAAVERAQMVVRLSLRRGSVSAAYTGRNARDVVEASLGDFELKMETRALQMSMALTVGDICVEDGALPKDHAHRKALRVPAGKGEPVVSVEFQTVAAGRAARPARVADDRDPAASERGRDGGARVPPGLAFVQVAAQFRSTEVIYLDRTVREVLTWQSGVFYCLAQAKAAEWPPPPPALVRGVSRSRLSVSRQPSVEHRASRLSLAESRASSMRVAQGPPKQPPAAVLLDVVLHSPLVTLPRCTGSRDAVVVNMGVLTATNRILECAGPSRYIDQMDVTVRQLALSTCMRDVPSRNMVNEESFECRLDIRRPLVPHPDAAVRVAADIGGLSVFVTDRQIRFISIVSQGNFKEPLRVPNGALFIPAAHKVAADEARSLRQRMSSHIHKRHRSSLTAPRLGLSAVAEETGSEMESGRPADAGDGGVHALAAAAQTSTPLELVVALESADINLYRQTGTKRAGGARCELLRRRLEASPVPGALPIARLVVGKLQVTYKTSVLEQHVSLRLPQLRVEDVRHAGRGMVMLSSGMIGVGDGAVSMSVAMPDGGSKRVSRGSQARMGRTFGASSTGFSDDGASVLRTHRASLDVEPGRMSAGTADYKAAIGSVGGLEPSLLQLDAKLRKDGDVPALDVTMRLQHPAILAEMEFVAAMLVCFVPGALGPSKVDLRSSELDFVLSADATAAGDLVLSPFARLITDPAVPGPAEIVYDGAGTRIVLPSQTSLAATATAIAGQQSTQPQRTGAEAAIVISAGHVLRLKNVTVVNAPALPALLSLAPGARLLMEPADGVELDCASRPLTRTEVLQLVARTPGLGHALTPDALREGDVEVGRDQTDGGFVTAPEGEALPFWMSAGLNLDESGAGASSSDEDDFLVGDDGGEVEPLSPLSPSARELAASATVTDVIGRTWRHATSTRDVLGADFRATGDSQRSLNTVMSGEEAGRGPGTKVTFEATALGLCVALVAHSGSQDPVACSDTGADAREYILTGMVKMGTDAAIQFAMESDGSSRVAASLTHFNVGFQRNLYAHLPAEAGREFGAEAHALLGAGDAIDPTSISVSVKQTPERLMSDCCIDLKPLWINLSPDLVVIVSEVMETALAAIAAPGPTEPLMLCNKFARVAVLRAVDGAGAATLAASRNQTPPICVIWKPRVPRGYRGLGHVATAGTAAPSRPVTTVSVCAGIAADPAGYNLVWPVPGRDGALPDSEVYLWEPLPPPGYVGIGMVATKTPVAPGPKEVAVVKRGYVSTHAKTSLLLARSRFAATAEGMDQEAETLRKLEGSRSVVAQKRVVTAMSTVRGRAAPKRMDSAKSRWKKAAFATKMLGRLQTIAAEGKRFEETDCVDAKGNRVRLELWPVENSCSTFVAHVAPVQGDTLLGPRWKAFDLNTPLGCTPQSVWAALQNAHTGANDPLGSVALPAAADNVLFPISKAPADAMTISAAEEDRGASAASLAAAPDDIDQTSKSVQRALSRIRLAAQHEKLATPRPHASAHSSVESAGGISLAQIYTPTGDYEPVFVPDREAVARHGSDLVSFWRPAAPPGWGIVGDCVGPRDTMVPPEQAYILSFTLLRPPKNGQALAARPAGFRLVYGRGGGGGLHIYEPVPYPGFVPLGCVASKGPMTREDKQRLLRKVVCLSNKLVRTLDASSSESEPIETQVLKMDDDDSVRLVIAEAACRSFALDPKYVPSDVVVTALYCLRRNASEIMLTWCSNSRKGLRRAIAQPSRRHGADPGAPDDTKVTRFKLSFDGIQTNLWGPSGTHWIKAVLRGSEYSLSIPAPGLMQANGRLEVHVNVFNINAKQWEPLLEPWAVFFVLRRNGTREESRGFEPGTTLKIHADGSQAQVTLAHSTLASLTEAHARMEDWKQKTIILQTSDEKTRAELMWSMYGNLAEHASSMAADDGARSTARSGAAAGNAISVLVSNQLGSDLVMRVDHGYGHITQTEILEGAVEDVPCPTGVAAQPQVRGDSDLDVRLYIYAHVRGYRADHGGKTTRSDADAPVGPATAGLGRDPGVFVTARVALQQSTPGGLSPALSGMSELAEGARRQLLLGSKSPNVSPVPHGEMVWHTEPTVAQTRPRPSPFAPDGPEGDVAFGEVLVLDAQLPVQEVLGVLAESEGACADPQSLSLCVDLCLWEHPGGDARPHLIGSARTPLPDRALRACVLSTLGLRKVPRSASAFGVGTLLLTGPTGSAAGMLGFGAQVDMVAPRQRMLSLLRQQMSELNARPGVVVSALTASANRAISAPKLAGSTIWAVLPSLPGQRSTATSASMAKQHDHEDQTAVSSRALLLGKTPIVVDSQMLPGSRRVLEVVRSAYRVTNRLPFAVELFADVVHEDAGDDGVPMTPTSQIAAATQSSRRFAASGHTSSSGTNATATSGRFVAPMTTNEGNIPSNVRSVEIEVLENQRYKPFKGWGGKGHLLPTDRPAYTHQHPASSDDFPDPQPPRGWSWASDWAVDTRVRGVDADGWFYGFDFFTCTWPPKYAQRSSGPASFVRRRRWYRKMTRLALAGAGAESGAVEGLPPTPVGAPPGESQKWTRVGRLGPGETMPLDVDLVNGDTVALLTMRPVLTDEFEELGASYSWPRIVKGSSDLALDLTTLAPDNLIVFESERAIVSDDGSPVKGPPSDRVLEAGGSSGRTLDSSTGSGKYMSETERLLCDSGLPPRLSIRVRAAGIPLPMETVVGSGATMDWHLVLEEPLKLRNLLPIPCTFVIGAPGTGERDMRYTVGPNEVVSVQGLMVSTAISVVCEPRGYRYVDDPFVIGTPAGSKPSVDARSAGGTVTVVMDVRHATLESHQAKLALHWEGPPKTSRAVDGSDSTSKKYRAASDLGRGSMQLASGELAVWAPIVFENVLPVRVDFATVHFKDKRRKALAKEREAAALAQQKAGASSKDDPAGDAAENLAVAAAGTAPMRLTTQANDSLDSWDQDQIKHLTAQGCRGTVLPGGFAMLALPPLSAKEQQKGYDVGVAFRLPGSEWSYPIGLVQEGPRPGGLPMRLMGAARELVAHVVLGAAATTRCGSPTWQLTLWPAMRVWNATGMPMTAWFRSGPDDPASMRAKADSPALLRLHPTPEPHAAVWRPKGDVGAVRFLAGVLRASGNAGPGTPQHEEAARENDDMQKHWTLPMRLCQDTKPRHVTIDLSESTLANLGSVDYQTVATVLSRGPLALEVHMGIDTAGVMQIRLTGIMSSGRNVLVNASPVNLLCEFQAMSDSPGDSGRSNSAEVRLGAFEAVSVRWDAPNENTHAVVYAREADEKFERAVARGATHAARTSVDAAHDVARTRRFAMDCRSGGTLHCMAVRWSPMALTSWRDPVTGAEAEPPEPSPTKQAPQSPTKQGPQSPRSPKFEPSPSRRSFRADSSRRAEARPQPMHGLRVLCRKRVQDRGIFGPEASKISPVDVLLHELRFEPHLARVDAALPSDNALSDEAVAAEHELSDVAAPWLAMLRVQFEPNDVALSIIDHRSTELLLMTFTGLRLSYTTGLGFQGMRRIHVRLSDLQIDNMLPGAHFPVLLFAKRSTSLPIFEVVLAEETEVAQESSRWPALIFNSGGKLVLKAHETLIWRLFEMFLSVAAVLTRSKGATGDDGLQAAEADLIVRARSDPWVTVGHLALGAQSLRIDFKPDEAVRPEALVSSGYLATVLPVVSGFANLSHLWVSFLGIVESPAIMRKSRICPEILDRVKGQLIGQWTRVLMASAWSTGIFTAINTGLAAASLDSGSQSIDSTMGDTLVEGVARGAKAAAKSTFRGITGVFTKPIEGLKQEGKVGFFKGVGKGLFGVAAQPITGIAAGVVHSIEGGWMSLKSTMGNLLGDDMPDPPQARLPRAVGLDGHVMPFDRRAAEGLALLHCVTADDTFKTKLRTKMRVFSKEVCEAIGDTNLIPALLTGRTEQQAEAASTAAGSLVPEIYVGHWYVSRSKILLASTMQLVLVHAPAGIDFVTSRSPPPHVKRPKALYAVPWSDVLHIETMGYTQTGGRGTISSGRTVGHNEADEEAIGSDDEFEERESVDSSDSLSSTQSSMFAAPSKQSSASALAAQKERRSIEASVSQVGRARRAPKAKPDAALAIHLKGFSMSAPARSRRGKRGLSPFLRVVDVRGTGPNDNCVELALQIRAALREVQLRVQGTTLGTLPVLQPSLSLGSGDMGPPRMSGETPAPPSPARQLAPLGHRRGMSFDQDADLDGSSGALMSPVTPGRMERTNRIMPASRPSRLQIQVAPTVLRIVCAAFKELWSPRKATIASGPSGLGMARKPIFGLAVFAPRPPAGFVALGHVFQPPADPPPTTVMVYRDDALSTTLLGESGRTRPRLALPLEFFLVWRGLGGPNHAPISIWRGVPPPGYVSVGAVAVAGMHEPDISCVRCVREDLAVPCGLVDEGKGAWSSASTRKADWPVSVWRVDNEAKTSVAVRSRKDPPFKMAFTVELGDS
ncbi:unnamed protein product [Pedinophyceae sp. YPF-701]|nr:unnamed protein product [Pedinophyceae sp. YPF-701]